MEHIMATPTLDLAPLMQPHWTADQQRAVARVGAFVQLLMNDHDFDAVLDRFSGSSYVQHNRGIPDGLPGLVGYVKDLVRRFPEYAYDVKRVSVDGMQVTFQSHVTLKAKHRGNERKGFNIIDTWQVVDGEIGDHWDAIQPLSWSARLLTLFIGGRIAHQNSIF
jgi:predicted SnoaL-like aldol condensation-catalyzing enzyme